MFRLHCKSVNVPVALASGDDSKSALDVLTHWTEDLKADGVAFPTFGKTFEHYRAIQAKVDTEAQKSRGKLADLAGKAAGKTAETATAAAAGAALGSIIPGIGTIAGAIGGMGAEALVDWMRGFLSKPDIDLLLDPTKKLTDDFLDDLGKIAEKKRIVLMLDTFEQMTALDDWARDVAQRVNGNSLLVIAGRALPNWSRAWSGWMANAQVEELKPMTEEVMRELIRRYYATMRGGEPNPTQVDAIIRFARGLPMVVTSAVQLWVKYGVEDFQSVKAEIVANLVDRLMEGVPSALIPALEAAAIVRWFDQPILRAVTGLADVRDVYNELRRFPFVRTRVEGLALHDAVREIMDENLRAQDSERHCELHERAAAYFEKRLEKMSPKGGCWDLEWRRLVTELILHTLPYDERKGIAIAIPVLDESIRSYNTSFCNELLGQIETDQLKEITHKEWLLFYQLFVLDRQRKLPIRQLIKEYTNLFASLDQQLKMYIADNLGGLVLSVGEWSEAEKWFDLGIQCGESSQSTDSSGFIRILRGRAYLFRQKRDFEHALELYMRVEEICIRVRDTNALVHTYQMIGGTYRDQGNYDEALKYYQKALANIENLPQDFGLINRAAVLNSIASTYLLKDDWGSADSFTQQSLQIARRLEIVHEIIGALSVSVIANYHKQKWDQLFEELPELEKLALQRYPDHLARAIVLKGHIAWNGFILEWGKGFDVAKGLYCRAIIYALNYNRFLLDDLLTGRPQGVSLRSIIPYCLERGEEGRKMLMALRDWWKTGVNDIGTPRPDTISPIPEGIALLEAERIAREREPGDGSPQKSVVEQIENALTIGGNQ
jgi:tetratricopeptide (TPR) repeat protein